MATQSPHEKRRLISDLAEEKGDTEAHLQYGSAMPSTLSKNDLTPSAEQTAIKRRWTRRQWTIYISIIMSMLLMYTAFSMIGPFFPQEAKKLGCTDFEIGMIFSCFQATMFIMSPIYGKLIVHLRPRFMCIAGTFLGGGCCILFGFITYSSGLSFLILAIVVRLVEGNGTAMLNVAGSSVVMKTFPDEISLVTSWLETVNGLGYVLGPLVGSGLYTLGGYYLPFLVIGCITLANTMVMIYVLPDVVETEVQSNNYFKLLAIPQVAMITLYMVTASLGLSFLDPIFSPWLASKFKISTATVGLVFIGWSITYCLICPLVGKLCGKGYVFSSMVVSIIATGLGYIALGPAPFLTDWFNLETSFAFCIVITALIGVLMSGMYAPQYQALIDGVKVSKMSCELETLGMVSGLSNSSNSLGSFIGPLIAGAMSDSIGFETSVAYMGLVFVAMGALQFCFYIFITCVQKKPFSPSKGKKLISIDSSTIIDNNDIQ